MPTVFVIITDGDKVLTEQTCRYSEGVLLKVGCVLDKSNIETTRSVTTWYRQLSLLLLFQSSPIDYNFKTTHGNYKRYFIRIPSNMKPLYILTNDEDIGEIDALNKTDTIEWFYSDTTI